MNPEVQLILGCFGLGLVITYALWAMIRGELLRCVLIEIRAKLDSAVIAKEATGDPRYLFARWFLDSLIGVASDLSPGLLLISTKWRHEGEVPVFEAWEALGTGAQPSQEQVGQVPEATEDISAAISWTLTWIMLYVLLGCFSGWLVLIKYGWGVVSGRIKTGLGGKLLGTLALMASMNPRLMPARRSVP